MMNSRKLVKDFYNLDFSEGRSIKDFLHPEAILHWNGTTGYNQLNYEEINELIQNLTRAYASLRSEVSHVVKEKEKISIRFVYFVRTIENPDEELPLASFIAIWEIKDGKLFKGYQISQLADDDKKNLGSFFPLK